MIVRCATEGCYRRARWTPTYVAAIVGINAAARCEVCCQAIAEAREEISRALGRIGQAIPR